MYAAMAYKNHEQTRIDPMLKRLALSAVLTASLSFAALAQQPPAAPQANGTASAQAVESTAPATQAAPAQTAAAPVVDMSSPEACVQSTFDLANVAEGMTLTEDQATKLEDLLTRMEAHCDAKQFSEATAVADDIKSEIQIK